MTRKRRIGWLAKGHPLRKQRAAACAAALFVLALQCLEVRAELLFRSLEQVDGQQRWSAIRKYSNPSDTAHARRSADAAVPAEEVRVFLSGMITREDAQGAIVMASLLANGRQKLAGNAVWFSSDGGDVDAGMEVARILRKLGAYTVIGRNDQCMSACVFAFMGGERRLVAGRLGIHRPYLPVTQDLPDRPARFRHLQKVLRDFVEEMDFPASLYEAVMLVPPESMRILESADLKRFHLEGISPTSEDMTDAAAARRLGLSMAAYLKRKEKTPACAFPVVGQDRCDLRTQEAAASGGAADYPGSVQRGEAAPARQALGRGTGNAQGSGTAPSAPRNARGS